MNEWFMKIEIILIVESVMESFSQFIHDLCALRELFEFRLR